MSQANSGGPVVIPFVADRSGLDSFLAEIRKGYDMPIRAQFVGPSGPGSGPAGGSMSVATANGPTTFASQSGSSSYAGPGSSAAGWIGPGGSGFPSMGAGSYMSTASIGSWGPGSGGGQLNQATSQLASVVNQLSQVVGQLGSGAAGAASAGASGGAGGGRFFGLRTTGLSRYMGLGFLAHAGLSFAVGVRDASVQESLMGGTPAGAYAAEMALYNRTAKVPIFGPAADLLVDPSGREHLANARIMQSAESGEQLSSIRYSLNLQTIASQDRARVAAIPPGYRRSQVEAEDRYAATLRDIATARANNPQLPLLEQTTAQAKKAEDDRYRNELEQALRDERPGAVGHVLSPERKGPIDYAHEQRVIGLGNEDSARRKAFDSQYETQRQAAAAEMKGTLDVAGLGLKREIEGWGYSRERDYERSKRYPSQSRIWEIQAKEDKAMAVYLDKTIGGGAGAFYADMADARLGLEKSNFYKQTAMERFRINASTESLNIQSGRDVRSQYQGPGMRSMEADLNSFVRQNQAAIEEALQQGKPDVAESLRARGRAGVIGMRQRFYESFHDEVVSPLQMGGGSDLRQIQADFWKAYNDAQRAGGGATNISAGGGGSGDSKAVSENTKQSSATLNQIYALMQGIASKLNVNA